MRKILGMIFGLLLLNASSADEPCSMELIREEVLRLSDNISSISDYMLKDKIEASVFEVCSTAPREFDVRVSAETKKVRFSEFSQTYDTKKPYYFCKNKLGYERYIEQLRSQLRTQINRIEVNRSRKVARSASSSSSSNSTSTVTSNRNTVASIPKATAKREPLWKCTMPGYITTIRTVNADQKFGLETTYNVVCSPI